MKTSTQLALATSLLIANSCAKAPPRVNLTTPAQTTIGADGTAETKDVYKQPDKLSLASVNGSDAKTFDLTKATELTWISSTSVVISHADGTSIAYDFNAAAWSSVHSNPSITDYPTLYDFRDSGYLASTPDVISLKGASGKIVSVKNTDALKAATLLSANPGFVAFKVDDKINAIIGGETDAKLVVPDSTPAGITQVYPCNLHCTLWGTDGTKIWTYVDKGAWTPLSQEISLPAGDPAVRMAIRFREQNNPIAAESIFVLTKSGQLMAQVAGTVQKAAPTWDDVKALSAQFCNQCHLDDGYEKPETWSTLKSSMIARLNSPAMNKGAMPPYETKLGKEMSVSEKKVILDWIASIDQTQQGKIGTSNDPADDNSPITGDLKTLVEGNCLACHSDMGKNSYWSKNKANARSRIDSGNMPQGKALSASDKTKFLNVIDAIK